MRKDLVRKCFISGGAGVLGAGLLAGIYFGPVSWGESPQYALDQFIEAAVFVVLVLLAIGLQSALFALDRLIQASRWKLTIRQVHANQRVNKWELGRAS
ncbi:MAG: hypothetical protein ACLFWD_14150 [Anaerolineales bacterium]